MDGKSRRTAMDRREKEDKEGRAKEGDGEVETKGKERGGGYVNLLSTMPGEFINAMSRRLTFSPVYFIFNLFLPPGAL